MSHTRLNDRHLSRLCRHLGRQRRRKLGGAEIDVVGGLSGRRGAGGAGCEILVRQEVLRRSQRPAVTHRRRRLATTAVRTVRRTAQQRRLQPIHTARHNTGSLGSIETDGRTDGLHYLSC